MPRYFCFFEGYDAIASDVLTVCCSLNPTVNTMSISFPSVRDHFSFFVISVGGDSMEPTYHDEDKVFIEKCDTIDVGEVGIFVVSGDVYIKELGKGDYICIDILPIICYNAF